MTTLAFQKIAGSFYNIATTISTAQELNVIREPRVLESCQEQINKGGTIFYTEWERAIDRSLDKMNEPSNWEKLHYCLFTSERKGVAYSERRLEYYDDVETLDQVDQRCYQSRYLCN
jgi:hypothetical protein